MEIEHIALWTNDLEQIKKFYVSYFDCIVSEKYENKKKQFCSYFLSFKSGCKLEIMQSLNVNESINNEKIGYAHIAFGVGTTDKVDLLTEKFRNNGVTVYGEPRFTGDGYYESVILDPDNNKIELISCSEIEILNATIQDAEEMLYLQKCCYLTEAEVHNCYQIVPLLQTMEEYKKDFELMTVKKLVYRGEIIGSIRAFEKEATCYVGRLVVDKKHRSKGYGNMLLNAIEKEFEHVERFELFTAKDSVWNVYLYEKNGYSIFKTEFMDGMDFVFLEKNSN